jgi:hypothetical protein
MAQRFPFSGARDGDLKAIPQLAKAVIASYKEDEPLTYYDNLFRLQMVAGQRAEAEKTLSGLRSMRPARTAQDHATDVQYEIYLRAKALESTKHVQFPEVLAQTFNDRLKILDDRTSAMVIRELGASLPSLQADLQSSLVHQKGKDDVSLRDALTLIRRYQVEEVYREMAPLIQPMIDADDRRRYAIDTNIRVRTPDGATVCALIFRPRAENGRLPALLNFSIYTGAQPSFDEARRSASNGYVGSKV